MKALPYTPTFMTAQSPGGPARPRSIDLVEAAYVLHGDLGDWLARVMTEAGELDRGLGVVGVIQRHSPDRVETPHAVVLGDERVAERFRQIQALVGEAPVMDHFASPLARSGSLVAQLERAGVPLDGFARVVAPLGVADLFGQLASVGNGLYVSLVAPSPERVPESRAARTRWQRVTTHLGAGLRLMRRVADPSLLPEVVMGPRGKLLHAEPTARDRDQLAALSQDVRAVDRARGRLRRDDPDEALSLWRGLLSGRWSIADRVDADGRRFVIAYRNELELMRPPHVTTREAQVARWAAGGAGLKEIAYALGIGTSAVHEALGRVMRKLRASNRAELSRIWSAAQAPAPPTDAARIPLTPDRAALAPLTPAERHVAELTVAGRTVSEVAAIRGSSPHTVTNQLAAVHAKLGVRSRGELAALLAHA